MPTPAKGPRLGGGAAHERLLLANLSAALFTHKRITTTVTQAKRLKPYAEPMVTSAIRAYTPSPPTLPGIVPPYRTSHTPGHKPDCNQEIDIAYQTCSRGQNPPCYQRPKDQLFSASVGGI